MGADPEGQHLGPSANYAPAVGELRVHFRATHTPLVLHGVVFCVQA